MQAEENLNLLGVVAHTGNPHPREAEAEGS